MFLNLFTGQEIDLLKFLISGRLLSVKSKFSQAGVNQVWPVHKTGEPISSIPITRTKGSYRVSIEIWNSNPNLTLRFPKGELPFLRFYLPSGRSYGADLFQMALKLSDDHEAIKLTDGDGGEMSLTEIKRLNPNDSRFDQESNDQFVAVVLPIIRHTQFIKRKVVEAKDLVPHLTRKDLDDLLGLSWQESPGGKVEGLQEYQISETVPVDFDGFNGLIISGAERLPSGVGLSHSGSVLIDKGFRGPIRTEMVVENRIGSPRVFPERIAVFLHK